MARKVASILHYRRGHVWVARRTTGEGGRRAPDLAIKMATWTATSHTKIFILFSLEINYRFRYFSRWSIWELNIQAFELERTKCQDEKLDFIPTSSIR